MGLNIIIAYVSVQNVVFTIFTGYYAPVHTVGQRVYKAMLRSVCSSVCLSVPFLILSRSLDGDMSASRFALIQCTHSCSMHCTIALLFANYRRRVSSLFVEYAMKKVTTDFRIIVSTALNYLLTYLLTIHNSIHTGQPVRVTKK